MGKPFEACSGMDQFGYIKSIQESSAQIRNGDDRVAKFLNLLVQNRQSLI
jgi:hypothetical protein